jgi:hypothetical protein
MLSSLRKKVSRSTAHRLRGRLEKINAILLEQIQTYYFEEEVGLVLWTALCLSDLVIRQTRIT